MTTIMPSTVALTDGGVPIADLARSMLFDFDASTIVAADGASVPSWLSLRGEAAPLRTLATASGGAAPILKANALGALPALRFGKSAADDTMRAVGAVDYPEFSISMLFRFDEAAAFVNSTGTRLLNGLASGRYVSIRASGSGALFAGAGTDGVSFGNGTLTGVETAWHMVTFTYTPPPTENPAAGGTLVRKLDLRPPVTTTGHTGLSSTGILNSLLIGAAGSLSATEIQRFRGWGRALRVDEIETWHAAIHGRTQLPW
ncbi:hypothetical protein MKI84_12865 [Ancylobacter sp. A5.8]|uniref:hypothetical protein n=1 Tax=Ancylobacter gelatini TaxID=2919920 RepID=UPI001F4D5D9A|nr:hypothetical protein [Ancylobacter gelatini]MCJ8143808.1 hypothetical protein [Ancylobacter gelatini]